MFKKTLALFFFLILVSSFCFALWPFGETKNFFIIDKNTTIISGGGGGDVNRITAGTGVDVNANTGDVNVSIDIPFLSSLFQLIGDYVSGPVFNASFPIKDENTLGVDHLVAGTNISLSCTGSDENGNCTINSTASGGSGGFYYAGASLTLEPDSNKFNVNDANIISENSLLASGDNVSELVNDSGFITTWGLYTAGGNLVLGDDNVFHVNDANLGLTFVKQVDGNSWYLSSLTYIPTETDIDGNALGVVNGLDLNNSLSYLKWFDANGFMTKITFDSNISLLDLNNSLDYLKTIPNQDANILVVINSLDLNNSLSYLVSTTFIPSTNEWDLNFALRGSFDSNDVLDSRYSQGSHTVDTNWNTEGKDFKELSDLNNIYDSRYSTGSHTIDTNYQTAGYDFSSYVLGSIFNASFPIDYDTNITNLPTIPIDTNYATEGFDFADYLLATTFIPSSNEWDLNFALRGSFDSNDVLDSRYSQGSHTVDTNWNTEGKDFKELSDLNNIYDGRYSTGNHTIDTNWNTEGKDFKELSDLNNIYDGRYSTGNHTTDTNTFTVCGDVNSFSLGTGECVPYTANATYRPTIVTENGGGSIVDANIGLIQFYDNAVMEFVEGSATNPLIVDINFSGVTSFDHLTVREYYDGSASHTIKVQLWSFVTSSWEDYYQFVGQSGYSVLTIPVYDPEYHLDSGNVRLRLNHVSSGISSHRLYIDFAWLTRGVQTGSSVNLTGYAEYNFAYNNFDGNGSFKTSGDVNANRFKGDGSLITGIVHPYIPTEGAIDGNALGVINGLDLNISLNYWNKAEFDTDQNTATTNSPTFAGLTLSNLTATRIPFVGADQNLFDDDAFTWDNSVKKVILNYSGLEDYIPLSLRNTNIANINNEVRLPFIVKSDAGNITAGRIDVSLSDITAGAEVGKMVLSTQHGAGSLTEFMTIVGKEVTWGDDDSIIHNYSKSAGGEVINNFARGVTTDWRTHYTVEEDLNYIGYNSNKDIWWYLNDGGTIKPFFQMDASESKINSFVDFQADNYFSGSGTQGGSTTTGGLTFEDGLYTSGSASGGSGGFYEAGYNLVRRVVGDLNYFDVNDENIITANDLTTSTALYSATQNIYDGNFLKTGDWTGQFDGQEGSWYIDYTNTTNKPFISSTAEWDANWLANVFQTDFNANLLDYFIGQNISLLTNDSGYITSYTDTNAQNGCTINQLLAGVSGCTSTPTITGTNITGIPASSILAGTFGTGNYTIDGDLNLGEWAFSSDGSENLTLQGITADADFAIDVNDGGVMKNLVLIDASAGQVKFPEATYVKQGVDGTIDTRLNMFSDTAGKYFSIASTGDQTSIATIGTPLVVSSASSMYLSSSSYIYQDASDNFVWRDNDDGDATRMTLTSASGLLDLTGDLRLGFETARIRVGMQNNSGDVHFGSSGIGSPPNGEQDYGFYTAYNAYRSTDGNWYHSRQTTTPASRFAGGGTGAAASNFTWDYSTNVGSSDITWTNLMTLASTGELTVKGCRANFTRYGLGCIQTAEEGSGTIDVASEDCYDTYGGRLPSLHELSIAFNNLALTDETDDDEWVSAGVDWDDVNDYEHTFLNANVGTDISDGDVTTAVTSKAYRCFVPFGGGT